MTSIKNSFVAFLVSVLLTLGVQGENPHASDITPVTCTYNDAADALTAGDNLYKNWVGNKLRTYEILCGKPANLDAFIPTESETGDYNGPVFIDPSVSFTTLCDLIDNTPDIKKYIGEGVTGHTIFAPTDAAFAEISGYIPGLDALEMQHLLQLHILGDTYLTTSLTCGKMYSTLNLDLSTQQRSQTTCGGVASSAFQIGGGNVDDNFPEIGNPIDVFNAFEFYAFSDTFALRMKLFGHRFSADVVGCNGVIHVVDNVLLPGDDFSTKDEMLYRDIP